MHLFYQPDISTGCLSADDSRHAVKVLRIGTGEEVDITDGLGKIHRASITTSDARKCQFKILHTTTVKRRKYTVHLAVAPTKSTDRMEWLVEKCTEIGIERISFVQCAKSERKTLSLDRLQKIAISALKQSRQAWLPVLNPLTPLASLISRSDEQQRFIAHVDKENEIELASVALPETETVLLIGPEGDFTAKEIELAVIHRFRKVGLGPNRLRTETAALAAVMTLQVINQK